MSETKRARLDADRAAKPLTKIVTRPYSSGTTHCIGPGAPLVDPEYVDENGKRTPLVHQEMNLERLAEIEALTKAATPGPWKWWTSCSFRRLSARGDGDVACACIQASDGHPDIQIREHDMAFIESAREAVPALCGALREAWRARDAAESDVTSAQRSRAALQQTLTERAERAEKIAAAERALRVRERESAKIAARFGAGSFQAESAAHDECDARNNLRALGVEP